MYMSMLKDVLNHRDANRLDLFKRIILNTQNVVNKKMSFYDIDNDIYNIVSLLVNQHADSFREPNTVDESKLRELMSLLTRESVPA